MTDDEVLAAALKDGFELHPRRLPGADHDVAGWHRGDDDRYPCFGTEREAISWMRDRLGRGRVFR